MEAKPAIIRHELAILAHELREPIASILLAVSCAKRAPEDVSANREMFEIVERQVRHLAGVVDGLLELSQIKRGKVILRKELTDLKRIVRSAIETNAPLLRKKRHRVVVNEPDESVFVMADVIRIQQVMNNLLNNAGKYTEPGGTISVCVRTDGSTACIIVRDTGVGIPSEVLPRVFDLFHQGERRQTSYSGLGIGLALAKLLVELHGGSLCAHSDGAGLGSSFVVHLPESADGESLKM